MVLLADAEYRRPKSVKEVIDILEESGENAFLLAGGTDLVLSIKRGEKTPGVIVDLGGMPELRVVEITGDELHIGSMTTFAILSSSTLIGKHAPALQAAVSDIGSPQIRNVGTIGGNIATASPAGDCLPALVAHDAHIVLAGRKGKTRMELMAYLKKYQGRSPVKEVITEVVIPVCTETVRGSFVKLGRRNALAIARISVALVIRQNSQNTIKNSRLVLGAVGKTPVMVHEAEALMTGSDRGDDTWKQISECAATAVKQSIPGRSTLPYKERAVKGIVYEVLERAIGGGEM